MNMGKNIEDHQIILHEGSTVCNLILDPSIVLNSLFFRINFDHLP